jgi:outer membrane protein TolC
MSALTFRYSVLVLALFAAGLLPAESPVLTWDDCFARTTASSLDLSIARLKLKEAEAALKSQQSVYYPDITADGSRKVGERETDSGWSNNESASAAISGNYVLFSGFGNRARVSKTEAELFAEQANFDQTRSNVEYNLRRAFAQQLYAQDLITLVQNIAARRADNLKLVEMRYEGGRENKGSMLLKKAQYTEALYDVETAKRALELARRQLTTIMGNLQTADFLLKGNLQANEPPGKTALNELAEQTPTYRSAQADVKAAEQGYLISRSARFPTITASGSLGRSGTYGLDHESWSTGLSVSLPLFRGGELSQNLIASGLARERTRLIAEKTMLSLMDNLQEALNTYRDRYANLRVQEEQMQAAEVRAEVARAQYQQGLISFQDWDTIENALITAQKNRLTSLRTVDQAEAAWRNTMGLSSIE